MSTLFELTSEMKELLEMAKDPEIDEQAILDTMDAIKWEFHAKADGYARVMAELKTDEAALRARADAIEAEADRIRKMADRLAKNSERLRGNLMKSMIETGETKFKTEFFRFSVRNNPATTIIDKPEQVETRFLIPQPPKVDKAKIKAAIDAGENLAYAHLEQGKRLEIK